MYFVSKGTVIFCLDKKYGEKDINTAIAYTKLGRLYVLNDFYDQAIDILNDAMAIFDDLKQAELAADAIREKYQIEEVYVTGFWG